jgi:hypothetical protein
MARGDVRLGKDALCIDLAGLRTLPELHEQRARSSEATSAG